MSFVQEYYSREWRKEGTRDRRDRERYREEKRDRRGHRAGDRGSDSERREREWREDTPGRERGRRELVTPSPVVRDPRYPTPGHAGWDDGDTPGQRSAWDLPTPGTPGNRSREPDNKAAGTTQHIGIMRSNSDDI